MNAPLEHIILKEIVMFTADDEEENGKKSLKIFHDALGGKIIELQSRGHYVLDDMGTEEFPELLSSILTIWRRQFFLPK